MRTFSTGYDHLISTGPFVMQFKEADSNIRRVGVQEDLIKFRPSPNFKNMKKFLKNRNSYTETLLEQNGSRQPLLEQNLPRHSLAEQNVPRHSLAEQNVPRQSLAEQTVPQLSSVGHTVPRQSSPTQQPQPPPKLEQKPEVKPVVVQPPLPPYPPPPDSPPNLNIIIKKEREEEDESLQNSNSFSAPPQPSPSLNQAEQETTSERPQTKNIKKTMCKEFIRGDCKRSVCRFSHELDLSQLRGVFTFCWNYQNAKCTYPYCKFVHATVWEEAEFYRTGILPPHARSHMKKAPPPPPPVNEGAGPSNYVAPNQQPPQINMHPGPSMDKPMGVISCVPTVSMEQRPMAEYPSTSVRGNSPLKQDWTAFGEFSSSPRDLETEPLAKNCKNCEFLEYRLQYYKEKVEGMIRRRDEMIKKTAILNEKSYKLSQVLLALMKPGNFVEAGGVGSGSMERNMLEQLGHIVTSSNRLSGPSEREDTIKNAYVGNNNMSHLLAKIFANNDQHLTVDASRET